VEGGCGTSSCYSSRWSPVWCRELASGAQPVSEEPGDRPVQSGISGVLGAFGDENAASVRLSTVGGFGTSWLLNAEYGADQVRRGWARLTNPH